MRVKNYVVVMVLALLCVLCMPKAAMAAGGSCGTNAAWDYNNGVLTISGTGAVEKVPWRAYDDSITKVVINEGITGDNNTKELNILRNMVLYWFRCENSNLCTWGRTILLIGNMV